MAASINKVFLLGTIGDRGIEVTFTQNGAACATFVLVLEEAGKDGKSYRTFVSCELWGKGAEAASDLEPGALVMMEGRLRWRAEEPGSKSGKLVVSGFEVKPVGTPVGVQSC